jgi:hypothetical protein
MTEYRLGTGVTRIIPFYRRLKDKELITTKLLIIMGIVTVAKIAVLILWI